MSSKICIMGENIIKELRKQHNLTQQQLADKIGVTHTVISKYESGKSIPNPDKMKALSEIFSVSIDTLLGANIEGSALTQPEDIFKNCDIKFAEFKENAAYCENFDPGQYLERKNGSYSGLVLNGNICTGDNGPLYVPTMHLPVDAYRAWLKEVYPDYTIFTEEDVLNGGLIRVRVKIFRYSGDSAPFGAAGFAYKDGRHSLNTLVNFAFADALKRAMKNQGFGLGLNWSSIGIELPTYDAYGFNDQGEPIEFIEYLGPIYCAGELVRKARDGYKTKESLRSASGKVEALNSDDRDSAESLESQHDGMCHVSIKKEAVDQVAEAIAKNNAAIDAESDYLDDEDDELIERF